MKTKTLSAPLRLYWRLTPALDAKAALKIAAEAASLRVFFVTLRLGGARPDLPAILAALRGGGGRITLCASGASALPEDPDSLVADAYELAPSDDASLASLLKAAEDTRKPVTLSVVPERANIPFIKKAFKAGLRAGIKTFSLPNPDLTEGIDATRFILREPERAALKEMLEGMFGPAALAKLFVHDLFLHKALDLPGLGPRVEYAGCQAGDAIAYIGADGTLYPCATLPVALGSLKERPFRELWGSEERRTLRKKIASPIECAACGLLTECKGGCRGLAYATGGLDRKDPSCGEGRG